jgi:multisubunit Na+/H+ antiporter MnhC subunit
VKTRNLLIWSAIALTAIVVAFAVQLFTDSRFLG